MRVEARRVLLDSTAVSNHSHVPHDPLTCAGDWGCHGMAVSLSGLEWPRSPQSRTRGRRPAQLTRQGQTCRQWVFLSSSKYVLVLVAQVCRGPSCE